MNVDHILTGDCLEIIPTLPAGCADMVFADPPYNLQLGDELWRPNMTRVDAVNDHWDQFGSGDRQSSFTTYDSFTAAWLQAIRHVLSDNGTIWVIGTYHNIHRVGRILLDLGYWILNDIVWVKANPMPNFRGSRFTNAHETLLWAKKSPDQQRYTFNHHTMKRYNGGKQMRSDWVLPLCTGAERISADGSKAHSTQKPEALLERAIVASTRVGGLVLDPFFGTGTTGAVAQRLGRRWLGIEREGRYVELATRRLQGIETMPEDWLRANTEDPAPPPRVPFVRLVETGLLPAGSLLRHLKTGAVAEVGADGRLKVDDLVGSIHRVGAMLQGTPACNGWTTWLTEDGRLLDALRQRLRGTGV